MSDLHQAGGAVAPAAFDADRHIDAMSPLLGLHVTDEQRPGVVQFLRTAHMMAALVASAPLTDDHLDLAPTFCPGTRTRGEGA